MDLSGLEKFPDREAFVDAVRKKTYDTEIKCHGCAQVIVHTFLEELDLDAPGASLAASPFFAGVALTGGTCGALIGPLMALGLVFGRGDVHEGLPGLLAGVKPMRKLVKQFGGLREGKTTCRELTGVDMASPEQSQAYFADGGLERCAGLMAESAGIAAGLIWDHNEEAKKA